ncbi:MAG: hypothetical protein V1919_04830 [Candidatus Omnitrophota bacterium]
MADQIKELIEKINQEGVQAVQEKAREIESQAHQKAEAIVRKAEAQARVIIENAQDKVNSLQESSQVILKQAARDLLLTLKAEITVLLERLITKDVGAALLPETLFQIISGVIKEYVSGENKGVIVSLSDSDKNKLDGYFLNKLKDELKKGVELRHQEDIQAGFIISFNAGKSHFDFTDRALAQYLSSFLKPQIAELFKDVK